jgi:glutathionylspermidine amidase/synthetase
MHWMLCGGNILLARAMEETALIVVVTIGISLCFICCCLCFCQGKSTRNDGVKFGMVCGMAPGGVPAFSCDYKTIGILDILKHGTTIFNHQHNGLYYGVKYQCVEFSRRWLIHSYGLTYGDVGMAYEIFDLPYAIRIKDRAQIPWQNIRNGQTPRPVPGSVLIWEEGGEFSGTGHVAIVTEVSDHWIRVAEQNVNDTFWPEGRDYARELKVDSDPVSGNYFIHETLWAQGGRILGWKNLPHDIVVEPIPHPVHP